MREIVGLCLSLASSVINVVILLAFGIYFKVVCSLAFKHQLTRGIILSLLKVSNSDDRNCRLDVYIISTSFINTP